MCVSLVNKNLTMPQIGEQQKDVVHSTELKLKSNNQADTAQKDAP